MSPNAPVVTRFAPSPTGYLHIGGARTALFNWLYARARGGQFLLRIEDTDRARSTPEATAAILKGLEWLGLDWDGEPISQFERKDRHAEVARAMLASGTAYKCFSTPEEIAEWREANPRQPFQSPWRDATDLPDAPYAIRLKAPREGETVIADAVQGEVRVANDQLDDMVLLRSDGTPTYMLAVVVDDHDMGVTHVIRGDDHLTNTARQIQIYDAMGWPRPVFAHIPLIHGEDGKKLSKRHGAVGLHEFAALGYPAAAMRNYLARLGWSHGDDELFSDAQAREWFDLAGIGRAPARLDFKKLEHVSGHHIGVMEDAALLATLEDFLAEIGAEPLTQRQKDRVLPALPALKEKAKTLPQLLDQARFALIERPVDIDEKAGKALDSVSRGMLKSLTSAIDGASWTRDELEQAAKAVAEENGVGLGKLAGPLRAALAGRTATPSVFDMMTALGREESLARLRDQTELAGCDLPQMPGSPQAWTKDGPGKPERKMWMADTKTAKLLLNDAEYDLPILSPTQGPDVLDIRKLYGQADVFTYDPGFTSTASCDSTITYIDGDKGELWYRGYPIEQLAAQSHYLEVCYLLLYGELPTEAQLTDFENRVTRHTMVHEQMHNFFRGFRRDSHPMATMVGVVGAMSAFYHDSVDINDPWQREIASIRLIAKLPTIAAMAYKYSIGQPFVYPRNDLDYASNFLHMCFSVPAEKYEVNPALARAMDRIFTLHADHEQNASTSTVRLAGSSGANPFACIAAGIACLWGPAHGGANQACLEMLREIGSVDRIPEYIAKAKDKNDPFRLMGFGHRVYKNFDPRAKVMKESADEVLELLGVHNNPTLQVAKELERIALEDEYFVSKKLYPNVDFYSGIILEAMGFPTSMFTPIFALSRTVGWISQWKEMIGDPQNKIGRPRQLYVGADKRDYVDLGKR